MTYNQYRSLQQTWLKVLMLCLFLYAFFGRTFAYFFVGELTLIIGLMIFLFRPRLTLVLSDPVLGLWALFALWGLCRTVPYVSRFGFSSIRDAVLWGYGFFALLVVAFLNRSQQISGAVSAYRKFARWYLPIIPVFLAIAQFSKGALPKLPWASDISVLALKAPDAGVHLGAAGLFLLLFRGKSPAGPAPRIALYNITAFLGWTLCAIEVLVLSRGGFVALMVPIVLVSILKPTVIGWKVVGSGVLIAILSIAVLESHLITTSVRGRALNTETVTKNLGSIVGNNEGAGGQEQNKAWRLIWWKRIANYTIFGPYFWTGKGFGVNLATSDGPPGIPSSEAKLRSPHNGTMTVLARTGVPGLLIWLSLNTCFVVRLIAAYKRAMRSGSLFFSRLNLWILCYWLALIINMSFDVYLEGPQGGIWFWSLIGFGVAVLRVQSSERRKDAASRDRRTPAQAAGMLYPVQG